MITKIKQYIGNFFNKIKSMNNTTKAGLLTAYTVISLLLTPIFPFFFILLAISVVTAVIYAAFLVIFEIF